MTMALPVIRLDQLQRVLIHLPERRFRHLVQAVVRVRRPDDVPLGLQLLLILADWLSHLGDYLTDQSICAILQHFRRDLLEYQAFLNVALDQDLALPCFIVTVSDGRWVQTTRSQNWYDLEQEVEVDSLPGPCATHITCDLTEAYLRVFDRLRKLGEISHAAPGRQRNNTPAELRPGTGGCTPSDS